MANTKIVGARILSGMALLGLLQNTSAKNPAPENTINAAMPPTISAIISAQRNSR